MEKAVERQSGEVCHRCLQPVAPSAQRCPNCGERHARTHHLPLLIGILGVLALIFVAIIMVKVIQNTDLESTPSDDTEQSTPQQPEKPPPFNQ
jgi:ribosomal protein L32